jgi:hypothetical protein
MLALGDNRAGDTLSAFWMTQHKMNRDRARLRRVPNLGADVLVQLAAGNTAANIAKTFNVSELALHEWLDDPARAETVRRARKAGAAALAEQTLAIAEGELPTIHPITGDPVADPSRDKLRIQARQWLAERRDRATWGAAKEGLTINVAALHLDALRARPAALPAGPAEDTIYIVQSAEPSDSGIDDAYADSPLLG